MNDNAKGGKTYNRIVQSIRVTSHPVGPEHHTYDKHFKEWCKGKTSEEIQRVKSPLKRTKASTAGHGKVLSKGEAKAIGKKVITAKVKPVPITKTKEMKAADRDELLREKLRQMERQKLIDGLKPGCRCDHIKSVGNGL